VFSRLEVIELAAADYRNALVLSAGRGLTSGVIYDALHVLCAMKSHCERIYTYNVSHFRRLAPEALTICLP
ncbi:MAG TPA: hypothetical protein VIS74_01950, partial [Chthoniobacterales bacterium]